MSSGQIGLKQDTGCLFLWTKKVRRRFLRRPPRGQGSNKSGRSCFFPAFKFMLIER